MQQLIPEEQLTQETYDTNAEIWAKNHATVGFWREEMEFFKKLLPSGKILEIGSGGGRDAKELIVLGYDYVGTDISAGLLKEAQKENLDAKFLHQNVYDLDFPEGTLFGGFWASASLLHIPKSKINLALSRIHKFIEKDGIGFISLKQGEGERVEEKTEHSFTEKKFFAFYTEEEFSKILKDNNFDVIETKEKRINEKLTWLCFFVKAI